MSLVPENINEAIKHLTGRSEKELRKMIFDAPVSQQIRLAITYNVELTEKEIEYIKNETKKQFGKTLNQLKNAIIDFNKKYDLKLIIPDHIDFQEIDPNSVEFSNIFKTKEFEFDIDLSKIKILREIYRDFKIIYYYSLVPGGRFQIVMKYEKNYERKVRIRQYFSSFLYNEKGKLIENP